MLDIGAGDGRVLKALGADKQYAIEIALSQANDLIKQGIFLIGRDFYHVDLTMDIYSVIFCNPPYSQYEAWVKAIVSSANFAVLYLVIPNRWENTELKKIIEHHYEYTVVGTYDFSHAERQARAKVHVIRINAKWIKSRLYDLYIQETLEDAFSRWVCKHIFNFSGVEENDCSIKEETALIVRQNPIDQLLDNYKVEKDRLFKAFQVVGELPYDVITMMVQDKKSLIEILRKSIKNLKYKYWKLAFTHLEAIHDRLTNASINKILNQREVFTHLDFNVENVYSIVIWVIEHANQYIQQQIEDVFERLTEPDYITAYKSNTHWEKDNWRYTNGKPEKYSIGLDYRIVTRCVKRVHNYSNAPTVVDDFIVICNNLGFKIKDTCIPNYNLHSEKQDFYTEQGLLAFTMRFYTGNKNAHLKINKHILLKFNIEVAKIRKWLRNVQDIQQEFEVSPEEAAQLWNGSIRLIGNNDLKLIGDAAV